MYHFVEQLQHGHLVAGNARRRGIRCFAVIPALEFMHAQSITLNHNGFVVIDLMQAAACSVHSHRDDSDSHLRTSADCSACLCTYCSLTDWTLHDN
jgi:hypothetical protein